MNHTVSGKVEKLMVKFCQAECISVAVTAVPMEVYSGITLHPAIRFGKPCITGTRIDAATVLGRFAAGDKIEDIKQDDQLPRDQVMTPLACATHVAEQRPPAVKSA